MDFIQVRLLPDGEENLLRHLLRIGLGLQHAAGEAEDAIDVPLHDLGKGASVALGDPSHQSIILPDLTHDRIAGPTVSAPGRPTRKTRSRCNTKEQ